VVRRPPAPSDHEAFRVTPLGRFALTENWPAIIDVFGTSLADSAARVTVQPNLEILAPPDLEPAVYLNIARLNDPPSVDIYTAFAITWDSLMNALDRGFSAEQLLASSIRSARPGSRNRRQLVEDCEGRHGEVRIGVLVRTWRLRRKLLELDGIRGSPRTSNGASATRSRSSRRT
jgi:hypothetical protein